MKAIRVHRTGGPEVMALEEVDTPRPGPGEALVRHAAIGLNYLDVYFRNGTYKAASLPFIPGSEGAGTVEAVGEGVTGFGPGARVAYVTTPGSYAEARLVPAAALVPLPEAIDFETAAGMMLKGMTAEYLLFRTYAVQPGDAILVQAAAGGVGLILCQWAKALGATVIGTVGSPEKAELARAAGADHTILYREEDFPARVAEITAGRKCAAVYDGVGAATFPGSLDCLRPLGTFASFGAASGGIPAFDMGLLGAKGSLYATRPTLFTHLAVSGAAALAGRLFEAVASGKVKVDVSRRYALADAVEAHRALEARETTGSIVFTP